MIEPKKQDFTIYQGATWEHTYKVVDDLGAVVDISNCTALLHSRQDVGDADPPVLEVVGSVNGVAGLVQFTITPAMTVGKTWEKIGFDAELKWPDPSTRIDKLAFGTMKLIQEYTRVV
jgi:hypothetical protein